jgi:hypothetical protein
MCRIYSLHPMWKGIEVRPHSDEEIRIAMNNIIHENPDTQALMILRDCAQEVLSYRTGELVVLPKDRNHAVAMWVTAENALKQYMSKEEVHRFTDPNLQKAVEDMPVYQLIQKLTGHEFSNKRRQLKPESNEINKRTFFNLFSSFLGRFNFSKKEVRDDPFVWALAEALLWRDEEVSAAAIPAPIREQPEAKRYYDDALYLIRYVVGNPNGRDA